MHRLLEKNAALPIELGMSEAFSRSPLKVLELCGSPLDIAFQLGKIRHKAIHRRVESWNRHLANLFRGNRATQKNLEREFLRNAEGQSRAYLEEIRAIAEGANLPFSDLFRLNLTELGVFIEKCTDLIVPIRDRSNSGIMIAHNEDWDPRRNDIFILKARTPQISYAILAYDGYLPGLSAGMNSAGLCHSVNYLKPRDFRAGLPRIFLARHLVTAKDFKEVSTFLKNTRRAFGQAIHLAKKDRYWSLELTARRLVLRKVKLPFLHTNHYLSPSLKLNSSTPSASSLARLRVAKRILGDYGSIPNFPSSPKEAERLGEVLLSDQSGKPYPIWRDAAHPEDTSATLACAMIRSDILKMKVYRNRPMENIPIPISLP